MEYLTKGKRGEIYIDYINGKKVVIKKRLAKSTALNRIENEAYWLKILNNCKIGPRLIAIKEDSIIMELIEGKLFTDWIKTASKKDKIKVVKEIFNQCRVMDKLKVNKHEMHNPIKHIIIRKNKPVLIDFERCKKTLKPKNVTQFAQFLMKLNIKPKEDIKNLLISYKRTYNEDSYLRLLRSFLLKV